MSHHYEIRPAHRSDLNLLYAWRSKPHVRRWWGAPDVEPDAGKLNDPRIALWITSYAGRLFAFLQDYEIHAWPDHHFGYLPPGSRGIDLYIGEPNMLGAGHGSALLRRHVDRLFEQGVPAVGIDPHPDNAAAIRSFEKAGFAFARDPVETAWGPAILMHRHATPPDTQNSDGRDTPGVRTDKLRTGSDISLEPMPTELPHRGE